MRRRDGAALVRGREVPQGGPACAAHRWQPAARSSLTAVTRAAFLGGAAGCCNAAPPLGPGPDVRWPPPSVTKAVLGLIALQKKNTFTDFIACAEHLIAHKYTSPQRLCIEGRSGGWQAGLLGAVRLPADGSPRLGRQAAGAGSGPCRGLHHCLVLTCPPPFPGRSRRLDHGRRHQHGGLTCLRPEGLFRGV
jgi:hypothetical protein